MILPDVPTRGTLRRRIFITGTVLALVILAGLAGFLAVNQRMRSRLAEATDAYAEEQEIADQLTGAVMRQLLLVSTPTSSSLRGLGAEFRRAGDEASALMQRYLFRDLSPEERLQLEQVKEAHQRLEVVAARTRAARAAGGDAFDAQAATSELLADASALHEALRGFLQMREADLQSLRARQNAASTALYVGGAAFAVLILLGSAYLGRFLQLRVAEPLAALTDAARSIGEGDLDARVPTDHDREFAGVAMAFNRMAEDLSQARGELESHNRQLGRALEDVRQAQAELIESEKLAAMGRMTAGLAHELNNPLASVLGYGELLAERLARDADPQARAIHDELVAPIVQEAVRARQLVRNFVRFARGSGRELGPVRVRDALDVVVGLQNFVFERAGLSLRVTEMPDVWVRAEPQTLQEVFFNLVSNAYDAMREAGTGKLRIRGAVDGGTLLLVFEDQGPGLDNLEHLFEPFYTTKPVGQGTGLGLAMVHHAMEGFGGSVRAANRRSGGARFELRLRLVDAPEDARDDMGEGVPERGSSRAVGMETGEGVAGGVEATGMATEGMETGGVEADDAEVTTAPRVLVVEDEASLRRLQERLLHRLGTEVFLTASVAEAREVLAERDVDLVVSDVKMPGESGLDLYRWVVEHSPGLAGRFLFVTGDVGAPEIARLSEERPEIFLHKPFELNEFVARVSALLGAGRDA